MIIGCYVTCCYSFCSCIDGVDDLLQFSSLLSGPQRIGKRLNNSEYFVAGALTGFVASFAESPIDLVSHSNVSECV